jgi:class 3 adenylate cyclase
VAAIFVVTALMFLFYDRLVERRQQLILSKAVQSTAIVASIFPKNVRERLMQANENDKDDNDGAPNHRLTSFLSGDSNDNEDNLEPIADLFPNCTVLFADISGFTAWSSTRDPAQVFVLLQTVYQAFDEIAKQRKVFKVETIGDSCKFGHESQG